MFECKACTLRFIKAIAGESLAVQHLGRRRVPLIPTTSNRPFRRHASTAAAAKADGDDFVPFESPKAIEDPKKRPNAIEIDNKAPLAKELAWLKDRVKLAQHVHYTLRNNDPEKALNLCRLASKKEAVIVSWNHVVDWYMKKGKIDDALKVYNEMKKRAQFPDAYTYTLLLRGLANNPHWHSWRTDKIVARAVSIYNSLSSPTSRVKPNIFHTNAVLQVCAKAADLDAIWGIVSKLPTTGANAADPITYGIIIHALQKTAEPDGKTDETYPEGMAKIRNKAIVDGRAVWRDIISRWREGEIRIDEQLVVQMARLLLTSERMQDWDDVLNLIQQTMKIERVVPPIGSPDRNIEHVPALQTPEADDVKEDEEGYVEVPSNKAFVPVKPLPRDRAHPNRPSSLIWVQPGTQTLKTLIQACTRLRIPKAANQYWDVITSPPYSLQPNHANLHAMLRMFRMNRASTKAVHFVKVTSDAGLRPTPMSFILAMAVCTRDIKNRNVVDNAKMLVEMMEATPEAELSVATLLNYLMVSLATDDKAKIVQVLDHVHPFMQKLSHRVISYEEQPDPSIDRQRMARDKQEVLHLYKTVAGVIDALRDFKLVTGKELSALMDRQKEYTRFRTRMGGQRDDAKKVAEFSWRRDKKTSADEAGGERDDEMGIMALGATEPALRAFRRRRVGTSKSGIRSFAERRKDA